MSRAVLLLLLAMPCVVLGSAAVMSTATMPLPQAQMDSVDRLRLRGGFDAASVADGLAQEAAKLGKVAVTFEVSVPHIRPAHGPPVKVMIVGSTPELGDWKPEQGISLITTPESFPIFTGVIFMEPNSKIEYKYAVVKAQPGGDGLQSQWEAQNREITSAQPGAMLVKNTFRENRLTDPRITDEPFQLTAQEWCRYYKHHVNSL
mmetsp:Transcript_1376/g.3168  ORF Transcript_1376/g.3168 Transcript_1376/m.3168 type:complete len:204 (+) Transcript_1376:42-653(+)